MSFEAAILTPSGLMPVAYQAHSLADSAPHEPEGVYTIARTFQRDKALLLESHLARLEESARLEGIDLKLDQTALRAALRTLIAQSDNADSRFRITIPRATPAHLYLALESLSPVPPEVREMGVKVVTIRVQRHNPSAKTTAWMAAREHVTSDLPKDVYQAILVNEEGQLLEGTGSNFYAIMNGTLYTAGQGVLAGISRKTLIESMNDLLPIRYEPVSIQDLLYLSEAFLTSSSRGVVPIIQIDSQRIGLGGVGEITRELSYRYEAWTEAHLAPI